MPEMGREVSSHVLQSALPYASAGKHVRGGTAMTVTLPKADPA